METVIALVIVALVALAIIVWPRKSKNQNTPKNGGNYGGSVDQDPAQNEQLK